MQKILTTKEVKVRKRNKREIGLERMKMPVEPKRNC